MAIKSIRPVRSDMCGKMTRQFYISLLIKKELKVNAKSIRFSNYEYKHFGDIGGTIQ